MALWTNEEMFCEKNRTEPHMTTIRKLAAALEVDSAELVRRE